jgi:hypothetical protein
MEQTRELKVWSRKYRKPLLMWVKGFRVPAGYEQDVVEAIRGAVDGGADWTAMWGFEACKHISSIACRNSDEVWRLMGETFRSYSKGIHSIKRSGFSKTKMKKGVAV